VRVRHINSWQDERSEACARLEDELGDVLFDALLLGQLCAARSGGVRETDREREREREREKCPLGGCFCSIIGSQCCTGTSRCLRSGLHGAPTGGVACGSTGPSQRQGVRAWVWVWERGYFWPTWP
jgi:hypothetical protein